MDGIKYHRVQAAMTTIISFVSGMILIPVLRVQPKSIHSIVIDLHSWQRSGLVLLACVVYAHVMFKQFSPRLVHLRYVWTHPPTWFAWSVGLVLVGFVDVTTGLSREGYQGSWREWLGYAVGSIGLVALYRHLSKADKDTSAYGRCEQWIHAIACFLVTTAAGVTLLPVIRDEPKALYDFIRSLKIPFLNEGVTFTSCLLATLAIVFLIAPCTNRPARTILRPTVWTGYLAGLLALSILDVMFGLNPTGYRASWREWLSYCATPVLLTWGYYLRKIPGSTDLVIDQEQDKRVNESLSDLANAEWELIEDWLSSDATAKYDILGNRSIAKKLADRLMAGTASIGLIGPYGSGKSSIVQWIAEEITGSNRDDNKIFLCTHSCWGFDNSATSIHEMLAGAIHEVEAKIDTFHVSSLPESYRQTFSAGGEWLDKLSSVILSRRSPSEQFESLSDLLGDLNEKLVLVVEDLDRNDSRSFDIQEVLAFLQQLKTYDNISFVLSAGRNSSRNIDFDKLCDRIEYLPPVQETEVVAILNRVRDRCLDNDTFPHFRLSDADSVVGLNPIVHEMMRDHEEFSVPQAVASLLSTPRALCHALRRTYDAWNSLHGEINFGHLLGVNVLRFGAPEAFLFLIRRWDRLHEIPNSDPAFGKDRLERIQEAVREDWAKSTRDVDWNPNAAMQVMKAILPASEVWLAGAPQSVGDGDELQGIQVGRYWRRAISESIDPDDILDQELIADINAWMDDPSNNVDMIAGLTESSRYCDLWEHFAGRFFYNESDKTREACRQTILRIAVNEGPSASHSSTGFRTVWSFARRRVLLQSENREWLESLISEVSSSSIAMLNAVWHHYASPGQLSFVDDDDAIAIRQHEIKVLQGLLIDGTALGKVVDENYSNSLYQLVYDLGEGPVLSDPDVSEWRWLSAILLDGLRKQIPSVAVCFAGLIAKRDLRHQNDVWMVDHSTFLDFFSPAQAAEIAEGLCATAPRISTRSSRLLVEMIAESVLAAGSLHEVGPNGELEADLQLSDQDPRDPPAIAES